MQIEGELPNLYYFKIGHTFDVRILDLRNRTENGFDFHMLGL